MWHFTKTAILRWADKLLHIHDTPERTAASFAIGIAIGFSPFFGLHTAIGLLVAFALNLNRVAMLVGIYLHLPWLIPPYYASTTAFGAWLTGTHMPPDFLPKLESVWHVGTWRERATEIGSLLRPLLPAYFLGSGIACVVLGAVAYPLSLAFIRARRHLIPPQPPLDPTR